MHGEVHEADEIDGREVIVALALPLLFLDGQGRVVNSPFVEMVLRGDLDFADETCSVFVIAFNIDADIFAVFHQGDVFDVVGADLHDVVFRDDLLDEKLQETEAVLLEEEGAFQPSIQQDAGIAAHGGLLSVGHN